MTTEYFSGASDLDIAQLNIVHGDVYLSAEPRPTYLSLLAQKVAAGAMHGAGVRSKCYPQTRVSVQDEITKWIQTEGDPGVERILWVSGPAGAGKTAIAESLAESWKKQKLLAASFFFSAGSGSLCCQSKAHLIPTLAYQLIQHSALKGMRHRVTRIIQDDPLLLKMQLEQQLELLILDPLRKMEQSSAGEWPEVVLIDGLDECEAIDLESSYSFSSRQESKSEVQEKILSALLRAARDPFFPFRIIIVSRPDSTISEFFARESPGSPQIFLDEKYDPDTDITRFVQGKFAEIRQRFKLPPTWPPNQEQIVRTFVRDASGQFVYVATIMRYIEQSKENPWKPLERILDWDAGKHPSAESPFKRLDALYTRILETSPEPVLTVTWLHAILELHTEGPGSVAMVRAFLEDHVGEMERLLGSLPALLSVTDTFRFFHKSFLDFLATENRSGYLYVGPEKTTKFLQDRWYEILKNKGPQIELNDHDKTSFLRYYAGSFTTRYFPLSQNRTYNAADVQWWIGIVRAELTHEHDEKVRSMHEIVHEKCSRWFLCQQDCKIWRTTLPPVATGIS